MIGIYKIENKVNGKVYIGQSKNIGGRWSSHIYDLERGLHQNPNMQHDYNEFGFSNFSFEIIEKCSVEELVSRELFHIEINKHSSYNIYGNNEINKPSNNNAKVSSLVIPILSNLSVVGQNIILMSYIRYCDDKTNYIEIYADEYSMATGTPSQSFYSIRNKGIESELLNCGIYKYVNYSNGTLHLEFNDEFILESNFLNINKASDILLNRNSKYLLPMIMISISNKGSSISIDDLRNILNLPNTFDRFDCITSKVLKPVINNCITIGVKFDYKLIRKNRKVEYIKILLS